MPKEKEISFDELAERVKKKGPVVGIQNVKVSGIAVIKDKDGNIKGKMEITNLNPETRDKT